MMSKDEQIEGKITLLVDHLLKHREMGGAIRSEMNITEMATKYHLGVMSLNRLMKVYYTNVKRVLQPKCKNFKPTVAMFLLEYTYQNSKITKKYCPTKGDFYVIKYVETNQLAVIHKESLNAGQIILSTRLSEKNANARLETLQINQLKTILTIAK